MANSMARLLDDDETSVITTLALIILFLQFPIGTHVTSSDDLPLMFTFSKIFALCNFVSITLPLEQLRVP